jgi:hypothetical protein
MGLETIAKAAMGAAPLMSSSRTTSTSQNEPWKPTHEPLKEILSEAGNMYADGGMRMDPYTGQRVANLSAETRQGVQGMATPSSITQPAQQAMAGYLNGDKFGTIRKTVGDDLQSRYGSMFSGGATDNPLVQQYIARGAAEGMAGAEYDAGLSALGLAPTIAGMGRSDAAGALQGGAILDNMAQRKLDATRAQHYETENVDLNALREYAGLVQGIGGMGGATSRTDPRALSDYGSMYSGMGGFWEAIAGGDE